LTTRRKKKSLKFESSLTIDETSVDTVTLITNAEFKIQFLTGAVLTFRDSGLTGDLWVGCIKSSMYDKMSGGTPSLEKRHSSKKLKVTTKQKKI